MLLSQSPGPSHAVTTCFAGVSHPPNPGHACLADWIQDALLRFGTAQPTVTREEMLSALDELERLKPTEKDLKKLAPQLHVPANFKKAELLRQIREALLTRKGVADRVKV